MKIAYADPPYIGQAKAHYNSDEVDHLELLHRLCQNYDGWALSCSSTSLKQILALPTCPDNVRIGAWVKPFCSFKPNVNPAYAWEPILFIPARALGRDTFTIRDWVSANITLKRGIHGAKPDSFCFWLFEILGMDIDDELEDLFYGSGAVTKAWLRWKESKVFMSERKAVNV